MKGEKMKSIILVVLVLAGMVYAGEPNEVNKLRLENTQLKAEIEKIRINNNRLRKELEAIRSENQSLKDYQQRLVAMHNRNATSQNNSDSNSATPISNKSTKQTIYGAYLGESIFECAKRIGLNVASDKDDPNAILCRWRITKVPPGVSVKAQTYKNCIFLIEATYSPPTIEKFYSIKKDVSSKWKSRPLLEEDSLCYFKIVSDIDDMDIHLNLDSKVGEPTTLSVSFFDNKLWCEVKKYMEELKTASDSTYY